MQAPLDSGSESLDDDDSQVAGSLTYGREKRSLPSGFANSQQPTKRARVDGGVEFPSEWGEPRIPDGAQDNGGLGGKAPIDPAIADKDREEQRRIISQIAHVCQVNPKADIHATPRIFAELQGLSVEELKNVLFNVKQQSGGVSPYAASQGIAGFIGLGIEKKMQHPGYALALKNDVDFIAALDDMIGHRLSAAGSPIQLAYSLINAWFTCTPPIQDDIHSSPKSNVGDGEIPNGENNFRSFVDQ